MAEENEELEPERAEREPTEREPTERESTERESTERESTEPESTEPESTEPGEPDPEQLGFDGEEFDELAADDLEEDDDNDELEEDDEEDEEGHPEPEVTIEVSGLSLYTHMGVSEAERQLGQRLILDVRLDIGESDATVTDRIEDTVDYGEVCEVINLVAQQRNYKTLERFCAAVADRLIERYEIHAVWVKAAKPEPPIPLPVSEVSVEVWREA